MKCRECKFELTIVNFRKLTMPDKTEVYYPLCINCEFDKYNKKLTKERTYKHKLRIRLINEMGGKCVCCGLTQWWCLTLDHIKPIRTQDREELKVLYCRLLKYPELRKDYQILCFGCNGSKSAGEKCQINHNLTANT